MRLPVGELMRMVRTNLLRAIESVLAVVRSSFCSSSIWVREWNFGRTSAHARQFGVDDGDQSGSCGGQ